MRYSKKYSAFYCNSSFPLHLYMYRRFIHFSSLPVLKLLYFITLRLSSHMLVFVLYHPSPAASLRQTPVIVPFCSIELTVHTVDYILSLLLPGSFCIFLILLYSFPLSTFFRCRVCITFVRKYLMFRLVWHFCPFSPNCQFIFCHFFPQSLALIKGLNELLAELLLCLVWQQ
jgi:hypothetical protein